VAVGGDIAMAILRVTSSAIHANFYAKDKRKIREALDRKGHHPEGGNRHNLLVRAL
jgi:hypothetical protein